VIFVTAYDQYAMRAFEARRSGLLAEAVRLERLWKALDRARAAAGGDPKPGAFPATRAELAAAARPPGQAVERIVVRDGSKVHIVPVGKLDYVEAQDDYVSLHSEKKQLL
jgi:two-component system LytT family response regulator